MIPGLRVIWRQYCLRAAGPCLPHGPITQLSPYLTRNPGTTFWNVDRQLALYAPTGSLNLCMDLSRTCSSRGPRRPCTGCSSPRRCAPAVWGCPADQQGKKAVKTPIKICDAPPVTSWKLIPILFKSLVRILKAFSLEVMNAFKSCNELRCQFKVAHLILPLLQWWF